MTSPRSPRPRSQLPLWKKTVFSLVTIVLFFALLELILMVAGVRSVLHEEDPYLGFSSRIPLFVDADGGTMLERAGNKERFFNPQQFAKRKADDTFRIFCVGGSTTYGRPYDDSTSFCGWLRELLPAADSSRHWEVINAGGISYASYRVAMLAEELTAHDPDLLIVYCGHNEFLERRTYSGIIETPAALRGTTLWLARTRVYSLLLRTLGARAAPASQDAERELLPAEVEAILDDTVGPSDYTRDDEQKAKVIAHFRFNLARIVDTARAAGADVILVRPASNLRDCSPFKSEHGDDVPQAERRRVEEKLAAAREILAQGRPDEALEVLDGALAADERHAHLHFERGRALERLGRSPEAKVAFTRARDEDVCPLRALSVMEEIVTAVARERDVPLTDFTSLVESRSEAGIPDESLFLDHVHPTIEGHRLLALAILETMEDRRMLSMEPSWTDEKVDTIREQVEARIDRRAHAVALRNLAKVLGWAGKFEEARAVAGRAVAMEPGDAEAQFHLGVTLERRGDLADARARYELVLELDPTYVEAITRLGGIAEKQSRLEDAVLRYRAALLRKPLDATTRARLGGVLARRGEHREAVEHLDRALRLEPSNTWSRQRLGTSLVELGEHERAVRELEEVLRAAPDDTRTLTNLGVALAELGRAGDAERRYREALRVDPDHVLSHDNLGNLLAQDGRLDLAIAEFGEVLRVVPGHSGVREKLSVMVRRFENVVRARPEEIDAHDLLSLALATLGRDVDAVRSAARALELARRRGELERVARLEARLARCRARVSAAGESD